MFDKYRIKSGDSLSNIANRYKTTVDNLKDINNIMYPDLLRAGMEIVVPKGSETYFDYYIIEHGDTLYSIAKKYNINPELLALLNGLDTEDYIYPSQEILIPKSGYSYYMTEDGDTLNTVSDKFNIKMNKLLEENHTLYLLGGQLMVHKH